MLRVWGCVVALTLASLAIPAAAGAATHWLPPERLSVPAPVQAEGVDVSVTDDGTAIAVWERVSSVSTVQTAVRAAGGAWSAPRDLSPAGVNARAPKVRLDTRGDALVVWAEDRTGGSVIRARTRPAGGDFGPAEDLSLGGTAANPRAATNVDLAMNPAGAAAAVWERFNGTQPVIQAVVRARADDRFALPEQISTAAGTDPDVGIDSAGDVVAAWAGDPVAAATRPAGGGWSPPANLSTEMGTAPVVSVAPSGTAAAVWVARPLSLATFRSARVAGPGFEGTWGPETKASLSFQGFTDAALDTDGTLVQISGSQHEGSTALDLETTAPDGTWATFPVAGSSAMFRSGLAVGFHGGTMAFWGSQYLGGGWSAAIRPTGGKLGDPEIAAPVGTTVTGQLRVAGDDQGNAIGVWQGQDASGYAVWAASYDGVPPALSDVSVPASVQVGEAAAMGATATERVSGVTIGWSFGDGGAAEGASVTHSYAEPGTRTVNVTARDGQGRETRATRTLVVIAPAPAPLPGPIDADGDGFSPPADCNDAAAGIRPGIAELPGNAIDENCDGQRDPFPMVSATAQLTSQFLANRSTRLLRLAVRGLAAGDTVELSCTGGGCRKSMRHKVTVRKATKTLSLNRFVRGIRLKPRATLKVRITHPGQIARDYRYTMRSKGTGSPQLKLRCQDPGTAKLHTC